MNFIKINEFFKNKSNRIITGIIFGIIILSVSIFYGFYTYINNPLKQIISLVDYNYKNCENIYNTKIDSFLIKEKYKNEIKQKIDDCDNMYNEIKLFSDVDFDFNNKKQSPLLYNYQFVKGNVIEGGIYDYNVEIDENLDLDKSNFELYFSNDNYELIENIIFSFPQKIDGTLEEIISLLYIKNLYLINKEKIVNSNINNIEDDSKILEKIYSFQNEDGGFKKYIIDINSDIEVTIYVNEILSKLKLLGVNIDENIINLSSEFIKNNLTSINNNDLNYFKNKYVNDETSLIEKTKLLLGLIDTNYHDKDRIDEIVDLINNVDVYDYYLSDKEKSYIFEALLKYTNKYSKNENKSKFGFMLGVERNKEQVFWIGRVVPSFKRYVYEAKKIIYENEAFFRLANIEGEKMNFGLYFKEYLKDYSKIKLNSDKLNISRDFYNISEEKKLKKCFLNNDFLCNEVYIKKDDNVFEEGKIYKVSINIKNSTSTGELVLEDFIPDNFIFTKLEDKYSKNDYKYISYDNNKLKVIFENKNEINFDYYIKAKTKGVFDYYPSIIYQKEKPENIASSDFYKVEVK